MKNEYEVIPHSKIRHLNLFAINITYRNFHSHNDFELLLVLKGSGKIRIKNDSFTVQTGDTILIQPHEMHEIDSRNGSIDFVILQFSRHFINDYFPSLRNTVYRVSLIKDFFPQENYNDLLQSLIRLATGYLKSEDFYELECIHLFTKILLSLYQHLEYEFLDESTYQERKRQSDRVNRIFSYIDENYLYPIRLQDIARMEGITTTHLSHFFSEQFGIPFQEYLSDKRLEQALRLMELEKEDFSLSALSELSGFSDPKYLNKAFLRRFGISFREYRSSMQQIIGESAEKNTQILQHYYTKEDSLTILGQFAKLL